MTPKDIQDMHARAAARLAEIPSAPLRKPRVRVDGRLEFSRMNWRLTPEQRTEKSKKANAAMQANRAKK